MLNEQIWQLPRPLNPLTTPTQVLFKFSFVQSLRRDFFLVIQGYGCLTRGIFEPLSRTRDFQTHTSSYLHANSCCPNYESFSSISSIYVSKSWRFSIWQHLFAGFMAHEMARESNLLFEVFHFHDTTFAFVFMGVLDVAHLLGRPIALWDWEEEDVTNGTSVFKCGGLNWEWEDEGCHHDSGTSFLCNLRNLTALLSRFSQDRFGYY